jgi:DnaJ-class molecular chaperone
MKSDDCNKDGEAGFGAAHGSTTEPKWCDGCGGNGQIHVEYNWDEGYEEEITERCDQCGGRGYFADEFDEDEW